MKEQTDESASPGGASSPAQQQQKQQVLPSSSSTVDATAADSATCAPPAVAIVATEPRATAAADASGTATTSGATSPVTEGADSSQSSADTSVRARVDLLALASSARKLIDDARAALVRSTDTPPAPAPAVDVRSIKQDILKALAEARSTIAEIKGDAAPAPVAEPAPAPVTEPAPATEPAPPSNDSLPVDAPANASPLRVPKTVESVAVPATATAPAPAAVDEFDMFSMAELGDAAMPTSPHVSALTVTEASLQSNCDDAEGYYTATVGEVLNGTYRVLGVVGKGVFSTVLRCARVAPSATEPNAVAIKLIRNNDVMRDAAQTEVQLLRELAARDPRDKKHCVRLLETFEHRSHVALVFEPMQMNVREAMKKFGGKGGISIQAVRVFTKHLLIALHHLEACAIVHAGTS